MTLRIQPRLRRKKTILKPAEHLKEDSNLQGEDEVEMQMMEVGDIMKKVFVKKEINRIDDVVKKISEIKTQATTIHFDSKGRGVTEFMQERSTVTDSGNSPNVVPFLSKNCA
jgi:hypothetical protein